MMYKILHIPTAASVYSYNFQSIGYSIKLFHSKKLATEYLRESNIANFNNDFILISFYKYSVDGWAQIRHHEFEVIEHV